MNLDPLDMAIRHISETRALIDTLVTSSESFDYHKAKLALDALQKKSRELGKLQSALHATRIPAAENVICLASRCGCP